MYSAVNCESNVKTKRHYEELYGMSQIKLKLNGFYSILNWFLAVNKVQIDLWFTNIRKPSIDLLRIKKILQEL